MDTLVSEEEKLIILYQVVDGVSSRSFGLEIAKIVGFPDEIIKVVDKTTTICTMPI